MRNVPDWAIQVSWSIFGVFATGAFWYFLSVKNIPCTMASAAGAIIFLIISVLLHRHKDSIVDVNANVDKPFTISTGEETITFTELLRSKKYDVVKINAHTHVLDVMAESQWINHHYPVAKKLSQSLTTLCRLQKKREKDSSPVYFDVITIQINDKRIKEIYFDISSFYSDAISLLKTSALDDVIGKKLHELYK